MAKKMARVLAAVLFIGGCSESDSTAPRVISTFPVNMSEDVDPSITEISVTFNEKMMDGNWSWAYEDKNTFPQLTGQPYYSENFTKNSVPVKLEPDKAYVIWINTEQFKNFKDEKGNSSRPFKFTFQTK